uniref:Uncharacterized protein LOC114331749 n=1 Tax=Diabrotica virgifera virgifera TaxID=50390 RepID=A0A6P7FW85_DIAVI
MHLGISSCARDNSCSLYWFQTLQIESGGESSQSIPDNHKRWIRCFVNKVMGARNPTGSNTRANSDNILLLVQDLSRAVTSKEKQSNCAFHTSPRIFRGDEQLVSSKEIGFLPICDSGKPSNNRISLLDHLCNSN